MGKDAYEKIKDYIQLCRRREGVGEPVLDERERIANMAEYYGYHWGNSGLREFALVIASGHRLRENVGTNKDGRLIVLEACPACKCGHGREQHGEYQDELMKIGGTSYANWCYVCECKDFRLT